MSKEGQRQTMRANRRGARPGGLTQGNGSGPAEKQFMG